MDPPADQTAGKYMGIKPGNMGEKGAHRCSMGVLHRKNSLLPSIFFIFSLRSFRSFCLKLLLYCFRFAGGFCHGFFCFLFLFFHSFSPQVCREFFDCVPEGSSGHFLFIFHDIIEDFLLVGFAGFFQHPAVAFPDKVVFICEKEV